MKNIYLIIFLLFPVLVLAQAENLNIPEPDEPEARAEFTGQNELIFGINSIPQLFMDINTRSLSGLGSEQFYHVSFKRHFQNGNLRSGINFLITPEDQGRYWVRGLNMGYEFFLTNIVLPINVTAGADAIFYHNIIIHDLNEEEQVTSFGLAPQISLNVVPLHWMTLSLELSVAGGMEVNTYNTDGFEPSENSRSVTYGFLAPHRFLGLSIGFRFGGARPPADDIDSLDF